MKNLITVLIIILAVAEMNGQSVQPVPTPVSWFYLAVEEDMGVPMELDNETLMAIMLQKDHEAARELMQNSFNIIKNKVDSMCVLSFLPLDELEGKAKYSRMGVPITGLKKAAKSADYPQYVSISIVVSPWKENSNTRSTSNPTENGVGIEGSQMNVTNSNVIPQVDIQVKFAGADGKATEKLTGRYRHNERIAITSASLSKQGWSVGLMQEADPIPYYYFLEKAAEDLANQINQL